VETYEPYLTDTDTDVSMTGVEAAASTLVSGGRSGSIASLEGKIRALEAENASLREENDVMFKKLKIAEELMDVQDRRANIMEGLIPDMGSMARNGLLDGEESVRRIAAALSKAIVAELKK
jgi:hypothetical protein